MIYDNLEIRDEQPTAASVELVAHRPRIINSSNRKMVTPCRIEESNRFSPKISTSKFVR